MEKGDMLPTYEASHCTMPKQHSSPVPLARSFPFSPSGGVASSGFTVPFTRFAISAFGSEAPESSGIDLSDRLYD